MRLLHVTLAAAVFFVTFSVHAGPPSGADGPIPRTPADALREAREELRFGWPWMPIPRPSSGESPAPIPCPAYALIWQVERQKEIGLSAEQKKTLAAIRAKAAAEAERHAEQCKRLSPGEQQAQSCALAGRPAPWRQQLDEAVGKQIEAVLTPRQAQMLREFSFPEYAVGVFYAAKMRREIGITAEQEDQFRRVVRERRARFQQVSLDMNEKVWGLLSPQQQAALPEIVKHQGPTSATLAVCFELGFDLENIAAVYPMLTEPPVRRRLGFSAEQEKRWQALTAEAAARWKNHLEKQQGWDSDDEKRRVEAILTPQQLTLLKEIDFHRAVVLALGYPKKRETAGVTERQWADVQRLAKEMQEPMYRIDQEMLGEALKVFTPRQREQVRAEIDRHVYGKAR